MNSAQITTDVFINSSPRKLMYLSKKKFRHITPQISKRYEKKEPYFMIFLDNLFTFDNSLITFNNI